MILTIEPVLTNERIICPECSHWDEKLQVLYWVDAIEYTLNKYNPATNTVARTAVGDKATSESETGYVYAIEHERSVRIAINNSRNLGCLGWNFKKNKMFFLATNDQLVFRYDYSPATGMLSPGHRIWFSLDDHHLDGRACCLQMDIASNLWVALYGTGQIIKIDGRHPETLLNKIELHESQPITSIAWGGKDLDELYVTVKKTPICLIRCSQPSCGCSKGTGLYRITGTGTRAGYPANKFVIAEN